MECVHDDKLFSMCMQMGDSKPLTASDIFSFVTSPFLLYCNHFVDQSEMDPVDEYQAQLSEQGVRHETAVVTDRYPDAELLPPMKPEDGFKHGLESMMNGVGAMSGCPLYYLPDGMRGKADVLERVDGRSRFGSHHYVVKEIKLARNIKKHHILQAAFYNKMLGKIQAYTPDTFYVINMDSEEFPFEYAEYADELDDAIRGIHNILDGHVPSATYGDCPYPWSTYGNKIAVEAKDVSLIGGLGAAKKRLLNNAGIRTVDDLASYAEAELVKIPRVGKKTAQTYLLAARAMQSGQAVRKPTKETMLPNPRTEIFLDLEGLDGVSTDDEQTDYLIGILVRHDGTEEYISFVAHDHKQEKKMLDSFLEFMKKQSDYVIYHWHHYERTHLSKMMEKYGIRPDVADMVLSPNVLFDLHKIATGMFAFPVPGTGLKSVAKWMGFKWQHSDVGALSSVNLYQRYVMDPKANRDMLDRVLDYNRDDCVATAVVKDWIVENER